MAPFSIVPFQRGYGRLSLRSLTCWRSASEISIPRRHVANAQELHLSRVRRQPTCPAGPYTLFHAQVARIHVQVLHLILLRRRNRPVRCRWRGRLFHRFSHCLPYWPPGGLDRTHPRALRKGPRCAPQERCCQVLRTGLSDRLLRRGLANSICRFLISAVMSAGR